jgi:ethanolamine ammonia-lyase small subunit
MGQTRPDLGESVLNDEELLEKAENAANGRKFEILYNEGWNSQAVRQTYSEIRHAQLAIVVHLTWWARHDKDQVYRLFKQSALHDEEFTQHPDRFRDLVRSACDLLGEECYDPNFAK